jgi:hypothetical protein
MNVPGVFALTLTFKIEARAHNDAIKSMH